MIIDLIKSKFFKIALLINISPFILLFLIFYKPFNDVDTKKITYKKNLLIQEIKNIKAEKVKLSKLAKISAIDINSQSKKFETYLSLFAIKLTRKAQTNQGYIYFLEAEKKLLLALLHKNKLANNILNLELKDNNANAEVLIYGS